MAASFKLYLLLTVSTLPKECRVTAPSCFLCSFLCVRGAYSLGEVDTLFNVPRAEQGQTTEGRIRNPSSRIPRLKPLYHQVPFDEL